MWRDSLDSLGSWLEVWNHNSASITTRITISPQSISWSVVTNLSQDTMHKQMKILILWSMVMFVVLVFQNYKLIFKWCQRTSFQLFNHERPRNKTHLRSSWNCYDDSFISWSMLDVFSLVKRQIPPIFNFLLYY